VILRDSPEEILRIKGVLILKRNATRDYLDFVALAEHLGENRVVNSLKRFDHLYPQSNQSSALQQLQIQVAEPLPYDLEGLENIRTWSLNGTVGQMLGTTA
jgi:hypothetical protein